MTIITQHLEDKKREHGAPLIQSNAEKKPADIEANVHDHEDSRRIKAKVLISVFVATFIFVELIKFLAYEYIFEQFDFSMRDRFDIMPDPNDDLPFLYFWAVQKSNVIAEKVTNTEAELDAELTRRWNAAQPVVKNMYRNFAYRMLSQWVSPDSKIEKYYSWGPIDEPNFIRNQWNSDDPKLIRMIKDKAEKIILENKDILEDVMKGTLPTSDQYQTRPVYFSESQEGDV